MQDVLARSDALRGLADEPFDVVVVGGGITGAGVALDAATRGFSVALVERADFASGTSSRSSKLVHGGLRYLQHFDLGLVREALLERQLMAALAPHLVTPLPLIVPAFDGARPDRLVGLGLNMYDVMALDRGRRTAFGRRRVRDLKLDGQEDWSPDRHRIVDGAEVIERLPALAARDPGSGYLFYDCQTDDARLVLTVLAEAERFGAVSVNRRGGHRAARGRRPRHGRRGPRRRDGGGAARARAGGRQRDGRVGGPAAARRAARRGRGPGHPPEPRHAHPDPAGQAARGRRRHRPRGRRADDLRAALARAHAGRHDRQRLRRRRVRPRPARRRGRRLPARGDQRVLRQRAGGERRLGRLRGRAAADLDGRLREVRRHLPQGRALRDLERDDHHHRRQADHLAANGEDDGRPDRRARGPRGAVPHPRAPARRGRRARDAASGGGRPGRRLPAPGRPLRPHRPRRPRRRGRARRVGPARAGRRAGPPGRGRPRRPPRAGPLRRGRAAAPHPARARGGAGPGGRARGRGARRGGHGRGARVGRGPGGTSRRRRSATRRGPRGSSSPEGRACAGSPWSWWP